MNSFVKSALKAGIGTVLAVTGTILGFLGVRDLCFEKHEVGDIVNDEEEVL